MAAVPNLENVNSGPQMSLTPHYIKQLGINFRCIFQTDFKYENGNVISTWKNSYARKFKMAAITIYASYIPNATFKSNLAILYKHPTIISICICHANLKYVNGKAKFKENW